MADSFRLIEMRLDNGSVFRQEVVIIDNIARRTFKYPRNPTIQWIADRLWYMVENGLQMPFISIF